MAHSVQVESVLKHVNGGAKAMIFPEDFDSSTVVPEPLPPVVEANGELHESDGIKKKIVEIEIVLGRNVHTTCLEVTEPEANDEYTGDKDASMAGILARYRKTLLERTKHHLEARGIGLLSENLYVICL